MSHFLRLLVATFVSAATAWVALLVLSAANIWRLLEGLTTDQAFDERAPDLMAIMDETVRTMEGGTAVVIAAVVSGIVLSEILRTRSLLFYAAAAGALAVIISAGLSPQMAAAEQSWSALAIAGFISGAVYWLFAGRVADDRRTS